jgi:4-diphosphocytidyl-2-C-methyl-D-erythritol kinase
VQLRAYAKINLSLKLLGKRPDGFHELESVMQSVSLFDLITLTEIPSGIELVTTNLRLPTDSKNLAYRAAELFFDRITNYASRITGVKIYLEKNIPLAAGLAGGSADAAAVLFGLNQLSALGSRLSANELSELAAMIGSDVPFCLKGGNCTATGRGECVRRNPLHVARDYVLVVPDVEVATKWAYEEWDRITHYALRITNESHNDLEPVVIKKYPVIQKVKNKLKELGCGFTQMSGSGPSVFGVVNSPEQGKKIAAEMKKTYSRSYFAQSTDIGVEEIL